MSTRTRVDVRVIQHDNYTATTTPATKTPTTPANFVVMRNADATNDLMISFDAGVTYFSIGALQSLSFEVDGLVSYMVKSSAATVAAQCLYGREI